MAPAAPNESLPGEPTNLERRQQADADTENRNNSGDRRASNLKAYHEGQIAELQKEIDKHQAIVDQQDAILSGDATEPLPAGTDIAAKFNQGENGGDERPPGRVNDLRQQRRQEREEREGNGDSSATSTDTSEPSHPGVPNDDPTAVNPDDEQPEDKSGDDENDKREKIADAGGQKAISEGEGEFEGSEPRNSPEPTSTPAEPVNDDAPKQDEAKLDDATKPTPKTPTPPSPRKK